MKEVLNETYTPGEQDFTPLVAKLRAANIDVVYVGGYHNDAGLLARAMHDQGMADRALLRRRARSPTSSGKPPATAANGTLMTFPPDPRKNPEAAELVARLRADGIEPEGYVLPTYAALQLWADAAIEAGSIDFDTVVAVLGSETFATVLGPVSFDAKGDSSLPGYVVYLWRNGRYDYAECDGTAGLANLITDVAGIRVGNASDASLKSGVTVVLCDEPAIASVHVMGGAPGTRETDVLATENTVERIDAVVLSGGSAFGLDAAGGVMDGLARKSAAALPSVPCGCRSCRPRFSSTSSMAATRIGATEAPIARLGRAALDAAARKFALGSVGAGTGATIGDAEGRARLGFGKAARTASPSPRSPRSMPSARRPSATDRISGRRLSRSAASSAAAAALAARRGARRSATSSRRESAPTPRSPSSPPTPLSSKAQAKRLASWSAMTASPAPSGRCILRSTATSSSLSPPAGSRSPTPPSAMIEIGAAAAACVARAIARAVYEATPAPGDLVPTWHERFGAQPARLTPTPGRARPAHDCADADSMLAGRP